MAFGQEGMCVLFYISFIVFRMCHNFGDLSKPIFLGSVLMHWAPGHEPQGWLSHAWTKKGGASVSLDLLLSRVKWSVWTSGVWANGFQDSGCEVLTGNHEKEARPSC